MREQVRVRVRVRVRARVRVQLALACWQVSRYRRHLEARTKDLCGALVLAMGFEEEAELAETAQQERRVRRGCSRCSRCSVGLCLGLSHACGCTGAKLGRLAHRRGRLSLGHDRARQLAQQRCERSRCTAEELLAMGERCTQLGDSTSSQVDSSLGAVS